MRLFSTGNRQSQAALQFLTPTAYIKSVTWVRPGVYGDKRLCNKQPGPGGGTRRLHHKLIKMSF